MSNDNPNIPPPEVAAAPAPKRPWSKPSIEIMGGPSSARSGTQHKELSVETADPYIDLTS